MLPWIIRRRSCSGEESTSSIWSALRVTLICSVIAAAFPLHAWLRRYSTRLAGAGAGGDLALAAVRAGRDAQAVHPQPGECGRELVNIDIAAADGEGGIRATADHGRQGQEARSASRMGSASPARWSRDRKS